MRTAERWRFLTRYLGAPSTVGALAPSSQALAAAICEPLRQRRRPARVLEVGAGTGAFTRHIGSLLGDEDEIDICEIDPRFTHIIKRDVLTRSDFVSPVAEGRVRLLCGPVQEVTDENRYDYVISGLPLTAFALRDVKEVFKVIQRALKPGGVLSYFEYVGLRRASRVLAVGERRRRVRYVSAYLTRRLREYQFNRQIVLRNFPPAYARHLRFD